MSRVIRQSVGGMLMLLFLPAMAAAQAAIAGVVKDSSGGVLPGVTVEASSPALIEKVRSVSTDATGQYRIVDLRPGTYAVSFTLSGFSVVKRDGIELTGTFVATVNAELRVGALEETITVSGEKAVIDVQSVKVEQIVSREILTAIPSDRTAQGLQHLVPGLLDIKGVDVGGASGSYGGDALNIHGGRMTDSRTMNDGLSTNNAGAQAGVGNNANVAGSQEAVINTSGGLGEAETSGVVINLIPRDGGNTFSGTMFVNGANGSMQGSNYTQALKDQGLRAPAQLLKVYDINPMGGGPIRRDRLWFYLTERDWGADNTVPGMFVNKNAGNPNAWNYQPDLNQPAFSDTVNRTHIARLTWQASRRNKFTAFWNEQYNCLACRGGGTATQTVEATLNNEFRPSRVQQVTWSSPVTTRLLLEAGYGDWIARFGNGWTGGRQDGTNNPLMIRVVEQGGSIPGLAYRAPSQFIRNTIGTRTWRASLSYVPGAHNMKFGYYGGFINPRDPDQYFTSPIIAYRFNNGVPNQLTESGIYPQSFDIERNLIPTSFYAQDQWTSGRLTLQGGLRYDHVITTYPEQRVGGTPIIPTEIVFPAGSTPGANWNDITPRIGVAYDLFGNGKTAVKVNLGKYMEALYVGANNSLDWNPISRIATSTTRAWTDANKDFVPQCDLANPLTNGECGPMANQNLGKTAFSRTIDPAWSTGWGNRPYNWEFGASVQREIVTGISATAGYYRRWFDNWYVIDNRATTASDYTPFNIVAPLDSRLPNGGGQTIGTLFDLVPAKVGQTDELWQAASNFGKQIENWHGVDISVTARLRNGLTVQGGTSTGRRLTDTCAIRDALPEVGSVAPIDVTKPININSVSPVSPYCRVVEPFRTNVAGLATYMIPKVDVQVSATWQLLPGPELAANYVVSNAIVKPTLGRDLSGGAANITVNLVPPATLYGDRINELDVRFAKILKFGRKRTQVGLDLYNATNTDTPTTYNSAFVPGGQWLTPTTILAARFIKVGVQFDF
jgi:hypothetical protein